MLRIRLGIQLHTDFGQLTDQLPANPVHISVYLAHLLQAKASYNVFTTFKYAIKLAHGLHRIADPTDHQFIHNLLESARDLTTIVVGFAVILRFD